ncbi:MAG: archease [Chloroflexi bacterium]|nr:archease [Chloroflexota bacterium]
MMDNCQDDYQLLDHTADTGFEVWGKDLAQLYINAGCAMVSLLTTNPGSVQPAQRRLVQVEGLDRDDLMVRWLNELLYTFAVECFVPSTFQILQLSDNSLTAELQGEQYNHERHGHGVEVKAATYHQLHITQEPDGRWRTLVVFDV